ncbi:hypothetical protein WJX74_005320 [Apatococcus lobatus]|uniref:tRNA-specific adenosine deaminase 1 n=1 Tax=Apatococcus lobatus TaxID=904363 RepID=A0AAW1SGM4_9CHLO
MSDVARAVLEGYTSLSKTGKPQQHEHTVLAGIVASRTTLSGRPQQLSVLSIGTGAKCLGASQRSPVGQTVNDSHAEVIARRAFVRWLYSEIQRESASPAECLATTEARGSHLLVRVADRQFQMAPDIRLHMFISQAPCGDACIYPAPHCDRAMEPMCAERTLPQADVGPQIGSKPRVRRQLTTAQPGQTGAKALHADGKSTSPHNARASDLDCRGGLSQQEAVPVMVQHAEQLLSCTPNGNATCHSGSVPGSPEQAAAVRAGTEQTSCTAAQSSNPARQLMVEAPAAENTVHSSSHLKPSDTRPPSGLEQNAAAKQHQDRTYETHGHENLVLPEGRADCETGILRRKPGRGEPTLSMSCSDKLARWAMLGLQGCLAMEFLVEPVYLSSIHIGTRPDSSAEEKTASTEALHRAFSGRMACLADRLQPPFQHAKPEVHLEPLDLAALGLMACADRPVPAGMSINWSAPPSCSPSFWRQLPHQDTLHVSLAQQSSQQEVTLGVSGRRAGAPKKLKESGAVSWKILSSICPAAVLDLHLGLMQHKTQRQAADSLALIDHLSPDSSSQCQLEEGSSSCQAGPQGPGSSRSPHQPGLGWRQLDSVKNQGPFYP